MKKRKEGKDQGKKDLESKNERIMKKKYEEEKRR